MENTCDVIMTSLFVQYFRKPQFSFFLILFDIGGGGIMPPGMFLTTVLKRLGEEAETLWRLILIYGASKEVIFGSLGYPVLPQQRVCQGVLEIFWSYRSICFLIPKF